MFSCVLTLGLMEANTEVWVQHVASSIRVDGRKVMNLLTYCCE